MPEAQGAPTIIEDVTKIGSVMYAKIIHTFSHEGTLFQIVEESPSGPERFTQEPKVVLRSEWGISARIDGLGILPVRVALDEIMKERKEQVERIKENVARDA